MGKLTSGAWQPFTPNGVAAFARARLGRLLWVQLIVALLVVVVVTWQLALGWLPTVETAIAQLPARGEIRAQKLEWSGEPAVLLAEGRFLALTVDLQHAGKHRSPTAHVQVEFGRDTFQIYSLLGYVEGRYPTGWVIAFNRTELEPLWGAWRPALAVGAGAAAGLWVLLNWWLLATLYFAPAKVAGFFANRDLTLSGSWKLSGAALMPGAVLMVVSLALYGFGSMDLVQLLFATGVHFVVGWIYLFLSLLFVPPMSGARKKNPFAASREKE